MDEFLRTLGRRVYSQRANPQVQAIVYVTENGKLYDVASLAEFQPGKTWMLRESHLDPAVFVLLVQYSNKWGEECVALFGDPEEAARFAGRHSMGRYSQQRVRLVTEEKKIKTA